MHLVEGLTVRS